MSVFLTKTFWSGSKFPKPTIEKFTSKGVHVPNLEKNTASIGPTKIQPHPRNSKTITVSYKEAEKMATENFNRRIQQISEERLKQEGDQ